MHRLALLLLALTACRPTPDGEPNYPDREPYTNTDNPFLPGPYPYVEGVPRLAIGVFYEGQASEVVEIGPGADYFIYEDTYVQTANTERIEGFVSAQLELTGAGGFWGGGVTWSPGRDLSAWKTMHISLQATDPVFEELEVRMIGGGNSGIARARSAGFTADGAWHSLTIPLADFALQGVDLTNVTEPLQLISPATRPQATIRVDDLFFTQEEPPTEPTDTGDTGTADDFLPGPDPWQPGVERLNLGLFYEGGASETVMVDNKTSFYYIYDNTYAQSTSTDRVEGFTSDAITLTGPPAAYFGGGVTWSPARDLSGWTRLNIAFKATDAVFEQLDVRMVGGGVQGSVRATSRGFSPDGEWHVVTIPLADFAAQGVNLSAVTEPLQLLAEATSAGAVLLVDNAYLDKE